MKKKTEGLKPKVAILTTVYPGVEKYLKDFLFSLNSQTDKNFKLFVLSDGMKSADEYFKEALFSVEIKKSSGEIAAIRKKLIRWALKENYEYILFADSDDYFSKNRVKESKRLLKKHDIVVNELVLFGKGLRKKKILKNRFQNKNMISRQDILDGNCFGLSNTAVKGTVFKKVNWRRLKNSLIAFDWALFTELLGRKSKAFFSNDILTYYRQHANNVAALKGFDADLVRRAVEVKKQHYACFKEAGVLYKDKSYYFRRLALLMKKSSERLKYVKEMKRMNKTSELWWEISKEVSLNYG